MIQFTKAQVKQLQKKGETWTEAISLLKEGAREVMAEPVLVPPNRNRKLVSLLLLSQVFGSAGI